MHTPCAEPRASVFYDYEIHPYRRPEEMDGRRRPGAVAIAGAGPIGLATALDLARFGIPSILLEEDLQVSEGSRAIVLTRRSLEILQQLGVERPFVEKGLPWSQGRSFYRGREIYRMVMPHDADDRYLPGLNIQQQYIEEYLARYCERQSLIELRWGQRVVGLAQDDDSVTLDIDTPDGGYSLTTDWLVAADGGRSTIRKSMQLRMEGRAYPGRFVIADIKARLDLPTERLCFFDPPWNPGNNVLVHREPEDVWRIDFRLPDGETEAQALEPALLRRRIEAVLDMIDRRVDWELDWATVYTANTLTLGRFVHGRVLFTGDAAHLLPIFGVRGINTGLQDCNNLAWKLAFVRNGWSGRSLLDTYSQERVQAAREICAEAGKSTRFMTPPSPGTRLLRDAVLSFSLSEDFPKDLLHWRTSRPHDYRDSALNAFGEADREFEGGVACGQPLRNLQLAGDDYLFDRIGSKAGFHLMMFTGAGGLAAELSGIVAATRDLPYPVHPLIVASAASSDEARAGPSIVDPGGRLSSKYAAAPGTVYLIRPDLHVCARWRHAGPDEVLRALSHAMGSAEGSSAP